MLGRKPSLRLLFDLKTRIIQDKVFVSRLMFSFDYLYLKVQSHCTFDSVFFNIRMKKLRYTTEWARLLFNDALNYNATDDIERREILSFFIVWKIFEILQYSNNFIEKKTSTRKCGIKIQMAIEVNITSRDFEREERDTRFWITDTRRTFRFSFTSITVMNHWSTKSNRRNRIYVSRFFIAFRESFFNGTTK